MELFYNNITIIPLILKNIKNDSSLGENFFTIAKNQVLYISKL